MVRIITYKMKKDRGAENIRLIQKVFEELAAQQPPGLTYMSYAHADGGGFTHIISGDGQKLQTLAAFQAFQKMFADRVDGEVKNMEVQLIGSYAPAL